MSGLSAEEAELISSGLRESLTFGAPGLADLHTVRRASDRALRVQVRGRMGVYGWVGVVWVGEKRRKKKIIK